MMCLYHLPPICKKWSELNSKCILYSTILSRSRIRLPIGLLVGSLRKWSVTPQIPSLSGILVYGDDTSKLSIRAPSGIYPCNLYDLANEIFSVPHALTL